MLIWKETNRTAHSFIAPAYWESQGRGIGRQLLNQAKAVRNELFLQVYSKNSAAAEFYRKQGFYTTKSQIDCSTGETELIMEWRK